VSPPRTVTPLHQSVTIGPVALPGELVLPAQALGLVVFAHGSGSSHRSARNRAVAQALQQRRIGSLLFDLLTPEEGQQRENVFDIELLAQRLLDALAWAGQLEAAQGVPFGLFGASTGAAAALVAAAQRPREVAALVSRGGRPDLAGPVLGDVRTPTLLIVGGADAEVVQLNMAALARLRCEKRLEIVARATHLFAEAGAMERVTQLARDWFVQHFGAAAPTHA
jgi:putative phosphoribosyl transferase